MPIPEAAKACYKFIHCGCKTQCCGRCKCFNENPQCTAMCVCNGNCYNKQENYGYVDG